MLGRVFIIALNTYRESLRARILIGLAGVAFAVALYSTVIGAFTLRNAPRVVTDLGSASMSLFSIAVAIIIGATTLHRELEQKTIFPILARPIHRAEYLVGKYFGTMLTILVFIFANAGLVLLINSALGGRRTWMLALVVVSAISTLVIAMFRSNDVRTYAPIPWAIVVGIVSYVMCNVAPVERQIIAGYAVLTFFEVMIIGAFATLFSSFSSPFLSALLTFGIFLIGRNADALTRLPVKLFGQAVHNAGVALSKVVPNLQLYVPPRPLVAGETVETTLGRYVTLAGIHSICWTVGLLLIASLIFRKRDFL